MTDPTATPKVSYTGRTFESFVTDFLKFLRSTRPNDYTDFTTASLGQMLIDLAATVVDTVSYGQDMVANEIFLTTCQRYESALRFAKSVGYVPQQATAATVMVRSQDALPASLLSYGGTVPAGTVVKGQNGLSYELIDDAVIAIGTTVLRLSLKEGASYTQEAAATAQQNQTIRSDAGIVEEGSWLVYVGDPDDENNLWEQVDNVTFETSATNTYDVSFDALGRILIRFGDGSAGAIPSGLITLKYRTTSGARGNVPVSAIRGAVRVTLASPGVGTVSVNVENRDDDAAVTGGTLLHSGEAQGTTVASATQSGTLPGVPLVSASLVLTIILTGGAGTLVLQDAGNGTFTIISNSTGRTLVSSAITYTTGAWAFTLDSPIAAGGTVSGTYYQLVEEESSAEALQGAATGGEDRESLVELKKNIPAYIRSQEKVLTEQDYKDALVQVPGISLSFVSPYISSYAANLVRVSVWSSELVGFQSEDTANGLTGTPVDYTRYTQATQDKVSAVQAYLRPRSLMTVSNVILRPPMVWVDVYLGTVTYDRRQDPATVRASITQNIVDVFQEGTGFAVRLSDIYDAARTAPGVRYLTLMRIATGTQGSSTEVQGTTSASPTVAGTLADPVATPGSVVITIAQTSGATIVIRDDKAGGFTVVSGTSSLLSGSIDYRTGAWTATFTAPLVSNQLVTASYANVTEDFRHDQIVTLDATEDNDAWPPPGITISNPISAPPYLDGVPLSGERTGSPVSPPYLAGDVLTYAKLKDITIDTALTSRNYYNDEFLYNNEIYYDSVLSSSTNVRSINLRRLVFDLEGE